MELSLVRLGQFNVGGGQFSPKINDRLHGKEREVSEELTSAAIEYLFKVMSVNVRFESRCVWRLDCLSPDGYTSENVSG